MLACKHLTVLDRGQILTGLTIHHNLYQSSTLCVRILSGRFYLTTIKPR